MQNFSKAERIAAAIYFVWFFVQAGLFFYSVESPDNSFFWPFIPTGKTMGNTYDITEFAVYILTPVVLFTAYKIVFAKGYEDGVSNRRHSGSFFIAFLDEKIRNEELTQKLNELQGRPATYTYLQELKDDRDTAASNKVSNWLDRIEVRKKYKSFES